MQGNLRSHLSVARGLGSAHNGTRHWWAQRMSAFALIPLGLWMIISLFGVMTGSRDMVLDWLTSGFTTTVLVLSLIALFWHAKLGIEVVIEDYIHGQGNKLAALLFARGGLLLCAAISVLSVIKLHTSI
ncbi:MAG: succinate dehydrogenase, hydrophobic membrane anchor protein [Alphaproteobacteria bacterium]